MLVVRFRETFRDRQMEWALSAGAAGWGAILIKSPGTFDRPFYAPLKRMADAGSWGLGMLLVGVIGLVALFINGAWRATPGFRQTSSWFRMLAWAGLLFGCLSVEWQTPAAMIYAMILFMEVMAMSNATADARGARAHA